MRALFGSSIRCYLTAAASLAAAIGLVYAPLPQELDGYAALATLILIAVAVLAFVAGAVLRLRSKLRSAIDASREAGETLSRARAEIRERRAAEARKPVRRARR